MEMKLGMGCKYAQGGDVGDVSWTFLSEKRDRTKERIQVVELFSYHELSFCCLATSAQISICLLSWIKSCHLSMCCFNHGEDIFVTSSTILC